MAGAIFFLMKRGDLNPFLRFPRLSLLAALVVLAGFWGAGFGFEVRSDPSFLIESDDPLRTVYEKADKYLPEDRETVVIDVRTGDVFTPKSLGLLRRVSEAFLERPGVAGVKSLTHAYFPERDGMGVSFRPLVPEGALDDGDLESLRSFSLSHPLIRNVMVSGDGRHAMITVEYRGTFDDRESRRALREEVESVLAPYRGGDAEFRAAGISLVREELERTLRRDLLLFAPAAAALLILLLKAAFPSWRLCLFILLSLAVYLSVLPGLFRATGLPFGAFAAILFPLLGGIYLTLMAHLSSGFEAVLREGGSGKEAVRRTVRKLLKSCVFASLTTGAGLLSLSASDVDSLRVFGLLGAIGVAAGFLLAFGPGLAVLQILFPDGMPRNSRVLEKTLRGALRQERVCLRLAESIVRQKRRPILPVGFILACALPGLFFLNTDVRVIRFLAPESPTRQMAETVDRAYGGFNLLRLEFDSGRAGGIDDREFLDYIRELERHTGGREEVSGAYSYALLMAVLNQVWEGGAAEALRVPESAGRVMFFSAALRAQAPQLPLLAALNDDARRTAYLIVRTPDMPSNRYLALIEDIIRRADTEKPPGVEVRAEDGLYSLVRAERRLLDAQLKSAWLSMAAIGLLLAVLWRSIRLACLGVLVAGLPVVVVLGAAGFAGVSLNSVTIMMAAIVMGVTVDDAVHFITYWRQERDRLGDAGALRETFRVKGPPVIVTSFILISVFALFSTASFPPVVHFGVMAAAAFFFTLAAVLFCLPGLIGVKEKD